MKSKSIPRCLHCVKRQRGKSRGLCNACYRDNKIRYKYPLVVLDKEPALVRIKSDGDIHVALAEQRAKHPLWQPVPYPRDDPRFNMWIAARRNAGLPEFHPED